MPAQRRLTRKLGDLDGRALYRWRLRQCASCNAISEDDLTLIGEAWFEAVG